MSSLQAESLSPAVPTSPPGSINVGVSRAAPPVVPAAGHDPGRAASHTAVLAVHQPGKLHRAKRSFKAGRLTFSLSAGIPAGRDTK